MCYVISDIHGLYDQYIQLLEKINFSEEDDSIMYTMMKKIAVEITAENVETHLDTEDII